MSGRARSSSATPRADDSLVGLGQDLGEDVDVAGAQLGADCRRRTPRGVGLRIGDDDHDVAVDVAQVVQRAGVEEVVGRHPEPLRRRTPVGDGLDVEQLLVVDVLGRASSRPRCRSPSEKVGVRLL